MEAWARARARRKLEQSEKPRKQALKEAFETTKHFALKFEDGGLPATSLIFNIGLYLLIAERDIQSIKIDALAHPDEWTRKLHARTILLTIYEWDADKVTGKGLREALDLIEAPDELRQEAIDALRLLRVVQRKIRARFSDLRNKTIAHRDPDAIGQYRAIQNLDPMEVMNFAGEFYIGVGAFMGVLTKLLQHTGTFRSVLKQWAATEGKKSSLP